MSNLTSYTFQVKVHRLCLGLALTALSCMSSAATQEDFHANDLDIFTIQPVRPLIDLTHPYKLSASVALIRYPDAGALGSDFSTQLFPATRSQQEITTALRQPDYDDVSLPHFLGVEFKAEQLNVALLPRSVLFEKEELKLTLRSRSALIEVDHLKIKFQPHATSVLWNISF